MTTDLAINDLVSVQKFETWIAQQRIDHWLMVSSARRRSFGMRGKHFKWKIFLLSNFPQKLRARFKDLSGRAENFLVKHLNLCTVESYGKFACQKLKIISVISRN